MDTPTYTLDMLWAVRVKLSLEVLDRTVESFTLGIV
jgi:hypothetical protein